MPPALPLSLDSTSRSLGWPESSQIVDPPGAPASLSAKRVRDKIGQPLKRQSNTPDLRFGVLMEDPHAQTSEPPLAIIAEATSGIDPLILRELHRLAWNFSRAPTVITVEPDLLRAWTCCEAPDPSREIEDYLASEPIPGPLRHASNGTLRSIRPAVASLGQPRFRLLLRRSRNTIHRKSAS